MMSNLPVLLSWSAFFASHPLMTSPEVAMVRYLTLVRAPPSSVVTTPPIPCQGVLTAHAGGRDGARAAVFVAGGSDAADADCLLANLPPDVKMIDGADGLEFNQHAHDVDARVLVEVGAADLPESHGLEVRDLNLHAR